MILGQLKMGARQAKNAPLIWDDVKKSFLSFLGLRLKFCKEASCILDKSTELAKSLHDNQSL